jgi:hypothetical protein
MSAAQPVSPGDDMTQRYIIYILHNLSDSTLLFIFLVESQIKVMVVAHFYFQDVHLTVPDDLDVLSSVRLTLEME